MGGDEDFSFGCVDFTEPHREYAGKRIRLQHEQFCLSAHAPAEMLGQPSGLPALTTCLLQETTGATPKVSRKAGRAWSAQTRLAVLMNLFP